MQGMAQKLFKSQMDKEFSFKTSPCKTALHDWPFLEHFFEFYGLNLIDLKLAATLLKNYTLKFESVAAFICHLLTSCKKNWSSKVKLENNKISPSVQSLWLKEAKIPEDDLNKLETLIF